MIPASRALGLASALSAVLLGACACGPEKGVLGDPGGAAAPVSAHFTGKLVLVLLQDKDHPSIRAGRSLWGVERPLVYRTHAGDTITVPAGMVTDLASIPSAVSWLLPPDGPWAQAAVVHDLLYVTSGTGVWKGHACLSRATPYTRAEADLILKEAMGDLGLSGWRVQAIYDGVRIGGARGWNH